MTEHLKPSVTADIIIPYRNIGNIVLIRRKHDPFMGQWALPGGFYETGQETTKQTAQREANEETGAVLEEGMLKLLGVYDKPGRDPRGSVISIAYYYVVPYEGLLKAADDADLLRVFPLKNIPYPLAFDHDEIVRDYLEELRKSETI